MADACPCAHHLHRAEDPLPTASLDDVAAQIRREFADQTSGDTGAKLQAAAAEAAEAEARARQRKTISQETFDECVRENEEEFDMDEAAAMRDAVEQFQQQGVDLALIETTAEAKQLSRRMAAEVERLQAALDAVDNDDDLVAQLTALADTCRGGAAERRAAGRHGAVGAAAFACKQRPAQLPVVRAALELLAALLLSFENREALPRAGAEAVLRALDAHSADAAAQAAGLTALALAAAKHEDNKRDLKDLGVNARLLACLGEHQGAPEAALAAFRFLRVYLADDDRRPGVQPGTFSRARELAEDYRGGALKFVVDFLRRPDTVADETRVLSALATARALAVNDAICKHFAAEGGLAAALLALEAHMTDEVVAAGAGTLLKTVARNDDIKRIVGKGAGLGLLLRALDEHAASARVCEQALATLSVLCLRQPEICERIAELGCLQLVAAAMRQHPGEAGVQRGAISTLRNMVSSWQNKDLCARILDEGTEDLIRIARRQHPVDCEEVAYAALRDLGLKYHE